MPLLFGLSYAAVAKRGRPFRRYVGTALLGVYGAYAVVHAVQAHIWWSCLIGLCALVAAIGVIARTAWSQALVWLLTLSYVGVWGYGIYLAAVTGYFQKAGLGVDVLSSLPGMVYLLLAGYCCYAVSQKDA